MDGSREQVEIVNLKSTYERSLAFFPAVLRQSFPRVLKAILKESQYFSNIASTQYLIISDSRVANENIESKGNIIAFTIRVTVLTASV